MDESEVVVYQDSGLTPSEPLPHIAIETIAAIVGAIVGSAVAAGAAACKRCWDRRQDRRKDDNIEMVEREIPPRRYLEQKVSRGTDMGVPVCHPPPPPINTLPRRGEVRYLSWEDLD